MIIQQEYLTKIIDLSLSFLLTVALSPILLFVAILIRSTSKGPSLYWSDRIGKNNKIFKMPKFRSMLVDTPTVATHLLNNQDDLISLRTEREVLESFSICMGRWSITYQKVN
jgi:O-antigen biosynthesis protein WbqP